MTDPLICPACRREFDLPALADGSTRTCPKCHVALVPSSRTDITASPPSSFPAAPGASPVQAGLPPMGLGRSGPRKSYELDEPNDRSIVRTTPFVPGGNLALAVKGGLVLCTLGSLVLFGGEYLQLQLANRLVRNQVVPQEELLRNDARQAALGVAYMLVYVITGILFLVWFHRVHANQVPLGARGVVYPSSGWAVGFFFVPIMNLFRPIQIAQEIWRNSDPDTASPTVTNSVLLGFWWAAWLGSNIMSQISTRILMDARTPDTLAIGTSAALIGEVVSVIAGVLCFAVVSALDSRQTHRFAALQSDMDQLSRI